MSFVRKVGRLLDVRAAALAGEDELAIRNVLEHAGGGLELVEVVVHEGAVALALAQRALRVAASPRSCTTPTDTVPLCSGMNHAQPVSSACSTRGQPGRTHALRGWHAPCRLQRLNPDGVFAARAGLVALAARPVAPARDVVEALVELVVLEVTLGHEARAAGGVDEVVEVDRAGGGGGAHGPVLVRSGDGAAGGVVVRKVKGGVPGVLEDGDPGRGGVAERHVLGGQQVGE